MELLSSWSIEDLWRGWCQYRHSTSPIWAKLEDNSKVRFNSLLRSGIIQNPSQATWIFLSPEKIRTLSIFHIFGVALCCMECLVNERDLFFIIFLLHGLPYFLKNYACIKKNSKKGQDCLMSVLSCKPVWGIAPGLGYEIPVNFSGHHYCCSKCESEILLYMKRRRKKRKEKKFRAISFCRWKFTLYLVLISSNSDFILVDSTVDIQVYKRVIRKWTFFHWEMDFWCCKIPLIFF